MNNKINQSKTDFVNLFLSTVENESSNIEAAKEFLASEGVDIDKLVSEGLKKIKKRQMLADASRTEQEMKIAEMAEHWYQETFKQKK